MNIVHCCLLSPKQNLNYFTETYRFTASGFTTWQLTNLIHSRITQATHKLDHMCLINPQTKWLIGPQTKWLIGPQNPLNSLERNGEKPCASIVMNIFLGYSLLGKIITEASRPQNSKVFEQCDK